MHAKDYPTPGQTALQAIEERRRMNMSLTRQIAEERRNNEPRRATETVDEYEERLQRASPWLHA